MNNNHAFYVSREWIRLRAKVLRGDKHECQICKSKGKYTKATHVHHVQHLREHPELGLSEMYRENGIEKRNLISVCRDCHETECHPERLRKHKVSGFINAERW